MKYFEFGQQNPELMVVLHGGDTSYISALLTVKLLSKTYHVGHMDTIQGMGYPFTYKVFTDMGHGGLAGDHHERFLQEINRAHEHSKQQASNGR